MLFENFSIILEHFPTIHPGLPRLGAQKNGNIDILESQALLQVRINLNWFDSNVATVFEFHFDNF